MNRTLTLIGVLVIDHALKCTAQMVATSFEHGSVVKTRFENGVWYTGVFKRFAHKGKKRKEEWMLIHYADGDIYVINPHKLETVLIPSDPSNPSSPYAVLPDWNPHCSSERADKKVEYDPNLPHDEIVRILS